MEHNSHPRPAQPARGTFQRQSLESTQTRSRGSCRPSGDCPTPTCRPRLRWEEGAPCVQPEFCVHRCHLVPERAPRRVVTPRKPFGRTGTRDRVFTVSFCAAFEEWTREALFFFVCFFFKRVLTVACHCLQASGSRAPSPGFQGPW